MANASDDKATETDPATNAAAGGAYFAHGSTTRGAQWQAGSAPSGATGQLPSKKKEKHFVSHGYRLHNEATYRGIDWILNSTVGVGTTYWVEKSKWGQEHLGKPVTNFYDALLKPVMKNTAARAEGAAWGKRFTSIMVGGFTIIPLMMLMENKEIKKSTIRWMDEKIYGKDTVANDPKFEEAYNKIDDEPKKGFWTGMAARLLAIAPLITIAVIEKTNKPLIKYVYDPIGVATQFVASKIPFIKPIKTVEKEVEIFDKATQAWAKKPIHPDGSIHMPKKGVDSMATDQLSNWDFLHRTIGFDFGLTIFYALMHEAAYKTLAAMGMKMQKDGKKSDAPQAGAANAAAPATTFESIVTGDVGAPQREDGKRWADAHAGTRLPEGDFKGRVDSSRTPGNFASVNV